MTDDYLDAFVREAEESIVELNNSLLALEDDPTDEEAMERIFRTAHTLKGNFGAMGFEETSDLAHAIEDLLDEIRDGEMAVTPAVMDHVFEGVDLIEAALDDIEAEGEPSIDATDTIAAIRALIEEDTAADEGGAPTESESGAEADADPDGSTDTARTDAAEAALAALDDPGALSVDGGVVHVAVEMDAGEMKGVDGMLALEAATEALDLLGAVPEPDAIQDGDYDDGFDLFVAADDPATVESTVADIGEVAGAAATDVTDAVAGVADGEDEPGDGEPPAADDEDDGGDGADTSAEEIKSVRVDVEQLDELYGGVEQLVTSRIKLRRAIEDGDLTAAEDTLDELDKITATLQGTVMDMRLIPLRKAVNTFPRMVRDIAREQDKAVDFEMEGTDVELDRTILDEISDPLMHVLRNAVDHGIEPPGEREAAGKDPEGRIRLRASRERDRIEIVVEDDGAGLDVDALREKALENGVRSEAELDAMDDSEVYDLIFHPGFSTADEVTDVSGRGVGMDVVHSTVNRLDGSVDVASTPGEGTTVTLSLPVSIAIVRVLFVGVGEREYGIPIKSVDEITRVDGQIGIANGDEVVSHGGDIYPVIRLSEALDDGGTSTADDGMLVRIRAEERKAVLRCDDVKRQEEVVIKPLEGALSDVRGLGGTAVVGDGDVVPILDVGTI